MATINNAILNRIVNEDIRPLAEKARALLIQSQLMSNYSNDLLEQLAQFNDTDIINDGRINEGIQPLTVIQLKNCINLLLELLNTINADQRLPSVLNSCVRKTINIG